MEEKYGSISDEIKKCAVHLKNLLTLTLNAKSSVESAERGYKGKTKRGKLDSLLEEKDTRTLIVLEEKSLKEFLEEEPNIYSVKDIKTKGYC